MAERRKTKRKKENEVKVDSDKPSKLEYEIAKYLRAKLQPKKTTLLSHKVDYFIASKAIDLLLDSKWAKDDKRQKEAKFTSRESVVEFMELMLRHKFFHRAKTVIVKKDKKKKLDAEERESSANEDVKEKKKLKSKESKDEKDNKDNKDNKEKEEKIEKSDKTTDKKKERKKVKLDMHLEQIFVDGNEPYVWIYDHIPLKAWLIGTALVFGAIAVCLFPLWPKSVRNYVYYLSIAAAAFLFFIIGLAVLRLVIFTLVWVFTFGKHHFWLLPNLTEDVGFLDSFWPLYKYEFKGNNTKDDAKTKRKDSDSAHSDEKNLIDSKEDLNDSKENLIDSKENLIDSKESGSESASTVESITKSNSSNENSKDVANGANGTNGFEILDSNDFEENEENEVQTKSDENTF